MFYSEKEGENFCEEGSKSSPATEYGLPYYNSDLLKS